MRYFASIFCFYCLPALGIGFEGQKLYITASTYQDSKLVMKTTDHRNLTASCLKVMINFRKFSSHGMMVLTVSKPYADEGARDLDTLYKNFDTAAQCVDYSEHFMTASPDHPVGIRLRNL